MDILIQLMILLALSYVSDVISNSLSLATNACFTITGCVIGIIILFVLLLTKILKVEKIKKVSNFFLSMMPVFFVAPGVSIITKLDEIKSHLLSLVIILFVGIIVIMVVTSYTCILITKLKEKHAKSKALKNKEENNGNI